MQQLYTEDQIHTHIRLLQRLPIVAFVELTEEEQINTISQAAELMSDLSFPRQHCRQITNLIQALIKLPSGMIHGRVQGMICDYLEAWEVG